MKISVEKFNSGISLKCFIPKSEITSDMESLSNDRSKEIRKQKTYKTSLSKKKLELLKNIVEELFYNFSTYKKLDASNQSNYSIFESNKFDLVKNKVFQNMESSMDEYDKNSFNSIYEIAKSFVFEIKHKDEINTIKDKYDLDSSSNILVSIIGTFRYGKTTLIKKIFGFDDDFIFPLVDKGRTSLSNCFFRAMLVKNENIEIIKDGITVQIPINEYDFKNKITLHDYDKFFKDLILPNIYDSFELYCNLRYENKDLDTRNKEIMRELKQKTLERFIESDKANFDELFGDINKYLDDKDKKSVSFYTKLLTLFDKIFNDIHNDISEPNETEEIYISNEHKKIITDDSDFFEYTKKYFNYKVAVIVKRIHDLTGNDTIKYNPETKTIEFKLKYKNISEIDDYYHNFVSNNRNHRGELLRLLVSEIYTEIDLSLDTFYVETDFNKFENISSIIFTDTMGAGHKSNKNEKTTDSSNDTLNNRPLLNESDIIILLDDASQSMQDTTLNQIKFLVDFGLKDKFILAYSWYDYFLKNDMKDDSERVKKLCNILKDKLDECFNEIPKVSKKLYSSLTETKLNRIIFLKGLVPYKYDYGNKSHENENKRRVNKSSINSVENESELAKRLNTGKDFKENIAVKHLIDGIIDLNDKLNEINDSSYTLTTNIDDLNTVYSFFNIYENFHKEYIASQYNEYLLWTPAYKTTEALCYRLKLGISGFSGTSRSLYPYNDAISIFMKNITIFTENIFRVHIEMDEDGNKKDNSLNEDFINNKIKNEFSKRIGDFLYTLLIISNQDSWDQLYKDYGSGVQYRRAKNIYHILENSLNPKSTIESSNLSVVAYNILKYSVYSIIEQYGDN